MCIRDSYSSPVQIPGATWTTPIVGGCGGSSAPIQAAIKTDGTLWSWGYGEKGGVGVNDKVYRSSPVQVPGTDWDKVTCGAENNFGFKSV